MALVTEDTKIQFKNYEIIHEKRHIEGRPVLEYYVNKYFLCQAENREVFDEFLVQIEGLVEKHMPDVHREKIDCVTLEYVDLVSSREAFCQHQLGHLVGREGRIY